MNPPGDMVVQSVTPDTFLDPYGTPIPSQKLIVDGVVSAIGGLVVIRKFASMYDEDSTGLTIMVDNNKLVRGGDTLLDNVEDLQFAYGVDSDMDGVIDTWTNTLPDFENRKWAIRYTLVVTSRPMGEYEYPDDTVVVEDHTYALDATQKKQKRAILTGVIAPPNLQP
jgi:hypothetical protein